MKEDESFLICVLSQLWEQTQAENTRLRLELSGVKNENETLKHQLGSAAQQVKENFTSYFLQEKSTFLRLPK